MITRHDIWIVAGILVASTWGHAGWEWKADDGTLPKDTPLGFLHHDAGDACISLEKEALQIQTNANQSAWIEIPILLEKPGAPLAVEVEASSDAQTGACALRIGSGDKGIAVWLWDGQYLRISTDGKSNHQYFPLDVKETHVYRLEIEDIHVRVLVDGQQIFAGQLDEPLEEAQLQIGDMTDGGASTLIFRMSLEGQTSGAVSPTLHEAVADLPWRVWKNSSKESGASSKEMTLSWPEEADGLLLSPVYRAATARQCQIYVLCQGSFGKRVLSASTSHTSVAANDFRKERFFLPIPAGTKTVRLLWEASPSEVPFTMQELTLMPVRIVAENRSFERTGGLSNRKVGQSFSLTAPSDIAGVAIPLTRSFDAMAVESKLKCLITEGKSSKADWEIPADQVPRDFGGMAVFLGAQPAKLRDTARFSLDGGIREPRFFGWYEFEFSWKDPFSQGGFINDTKPEEGWDMSFVAFAGLPRE